MPAPLTAQQSALTMSKRRAGSRQEVGAAAGAQQKQKPDQHWKALHGPTPELMVPLADQPGEIGFCDFTKRLLKKPANCGRMGQRH